MRQILKAEQARKQRTGTADKYPQKRFNPKPCRKCGEVFEPQAPSQLYCSIPCSEKAQRDAYYKRVYGITTDEWERMYNAQGGVCYICKEEGFLMDEKHEAKLMVDHDHETGAVRGLLCHNCNRALGLLKDDKERLRRAIEYLEGATTIH